MSTFCADGLIPARFLCLVAHFIMLVMALNYREQNVKACLPSDYDRVLYLEQDKSTKYATLASYTSIDNDVCLNALIIVNYAVQLGHERTSFIRHKLMIGYTLSIGFIGIEMFGFISGITMFAPANGFISMICHGVATTMMFYFLQDLWSCGMFWSVFFLCSVLPCGIELIMISYSFIMKK